MTDGERKVAARARGVRARRGNDEHRRERQVGRDPRRLRPRLVRPRDAGAAVEHGREVVDVPFEPRARDEQLGRIGVQPRRGRSRDEPEPDRGGARAEPALERDAVHEAEAVARDRREEREHAQREVRRVARQLVGALAADLDLELVRVLDLQLVPELERGSGRVEARAEVRGRRGREGADHPIASSTASSVASTVCEPPSSTAPASFSPCPVTMQTTVVPATSGEALERRDPGRRRRLAEDALLVREQLPGAAQLVLAERDDLDASRRDELGHVRGVRRLADPDRRGPRRRTLGGLPDDDPRRDTGVGEAGSDGGDVAAAAEGQRDDVGRGAELLEDLTDDGLLALDAVRVERVDEHESVALPELAAEPQRVVEAAATSSSRAPAARACARLAVAVAPAGVSTIASSPARAA